MSETLQQLAKRVDEKPSSVFVWIMVGVLFGNTCAGERIAERKLRNHTHVADSVVVGK